MANRRLVHSARDIPQNIIRSMSRAVNKSGMRAARFIRELRMELVVALVTLGALAGTTLRVIHEGNTGSMSASHLSGDCLEDWPPHA